MSSAGSAGASGAVLGIVLVLLAQQFGFLSLSVLGTSIVYLVVAGVVGGVLGALLGWWLGRRNRAPGPGAARAA
jgi:membrane protein YqaA with SNARE-associated domain